MIAEILSAQVKAKELGVGGVLLLLMLSMVWAFSEISSLKQAQPDKRLAVIESKMTEVEKKLDKMDAKLDRLLER